MTWPHGINDDGQIVGGSRTNFTGPLDQDHGFLLHASKYKDIFFPGASESIATGINDEGEIVGTYEDSTINENNERCFVRDEDGEYHSFAVPFSGPAEGVECNGINNDGDTVGTYPDNGRSRGWLRTEDGDFRRIDFTLNNVQYDTWVLGINDDRDIVGVWNESNMTDADGFSRAGTHCFLRHEGKYMSIDVPVPGASQTTCYGINNEGDIVGAYLKNASFHGFVLSEGNFRTIDVPAVFDTSVNAINDEGWIVGVYDDSSGFHGFKAKLKD